MAELALSGWPLVAVLAVGASLGLGGSHGSAQDSYAGTRAGAEELARQRELDRLKLRVGRFVSGDAVVFTGELSATERLDRAGMRSLPRGRVVASLVDRQGITGATTPGVELTVVSPEHGLWLRLSQSFDEPGVTRVTRLRPRRASPGVTGSCRGCLADLAERPGTLELDRVVATGRLRDGLGTPFRVELSGRLERVPPDELQLADLETLDPGLRASLRDDDRPFSRYGDEAVLRVEGELRQRVEPPPGSPPQTRCERVTRYSAERFVDLSDLGRFGVRGLEILGIELCCLDHDSHGGSEECSAVERG
jgi:hypothetical protein